MGTNKIYLKGLNGVRAIAALTVLFVHLNNSFPILPIEALRAVSLYAVTFFFTLSGFLITYLLLKEKEKTNTVLLSKFYARRILRIWPLYYIYMALALVVIVFIFPSYSIDYKIFYWIFFSANVSWALDFLMPGLAHYWSLAVEEQFYIFWPVLAKHSKSPKRSIFIFFCVFTGLKLLLKFTHFEPEFWLKLLNITKFDIMAIGGLTACLLHEGKPFFFKIVNHLATQYIALAIILLAYLNKAAMIFSVFEHVAVGAAIAVIIVNQCTNPKPIFSLENKVFDFLGKISFGIYVYHAIFIFSLENMHLDPTITKIIAYTTIPLITIIVAYISYNYYEKPFLHIKERFTVVASANSAAASKQDGSE